MYQLIEEGDGLLVKGLKDFDLKDIFTCGQAFRWDLEEDGSYTCIHKGSFVNIVKREDGFLFKNTSKEDFGLWYEYFDLARDYGQIKKELSKDPILEKAIAYGPGIRILNQDPFETLISFIISANNQIPRIKKSIDLIAKKYGDFLGVFNSRDIYSFPGPEVLARAKAEDLRQFARVGFRDERIVKTSQIVNEGLDLDEIFNLSKDEGKKVLMELPGVGPKVAECVLLFAYDKEDAFPVDTWVKRLMEHLYIGEETKLKDIEAYGKKIFGPRAGFAQQYLFYYGRELNIGK